MKCFDAPPSTESARRGSRGDTQKQGNTTRGTGVARVMRVKNEMIWEHIKYTLGVVKDMHVDNQEVKNIAKIKHFGDCRRK